MKVITFILAIAVIILGVLFYLNMRQGQRRDGEIKKLKENFEDVVNYDSILTAREKVVFDSLKVVRQEVRTQIINIRNENAKLRRQNNALEKRFRYLDLGSRPVF